MNMESKWFYSTPKEFKESLYFEILIDNNIQVGINESNFTEMLKRVFENFILISENGELNGVSFFDNPIFVEALHIIGCNNQLIEFSKDKITFLNDRLKTVGYQTTQPTPPQKEIKPIKWQKQSILLAYLINELKTYGFIDESNIWAISEQLFVDKKNKPIKAQTFTSMVKNYENNRTPDGRKGKPKAHTEITELVELLKKLSKEIDKP